MELKTAEFEEFECWKNLDEEVNKESPDIQKVCEYFIQSIDKLLLIDESLMHLMIVDHIEQKYLAQYIKVFSTARKNLNSLLKKRQKGFGETDLKNIEDFPLALKYSAYPTELIIFVAHAVQVVNSGKLSNAARAAGFSASAPATQDGVEKSTDSTPIAGNSAVAFLNEATTVTNSGKYHVNKWFGHAIIESVLHTLNEVLSIVNGHLE